MLHDILAVWRSLWMMFRLLILVWILLTGGRELPRVIPVFWPVVLAGLLPPDLG